MMLQMKEKFKLYTNLSDRTIVKYVCSKAHLDSNMTIAYPINNIASMYVSSITLYERHERTFVRYKGHTSLKTSDL